MLTNGNHFEKEEDSSSEKDSKKGNKRSNSQDLDKKVKSKKQKSNASKFIFNKDALYVLSLGEWILRESQKPHCITLDRAELDNGEVIKRPYRLGDIEDLIPSLKAFNISSVAQWRKPIGTEASELDVVDDQLAQFEHEIKHSLPHLAAQPQVLHWHQTKQQVNNNNNSVPQFSKFIFKSAPNFTPEQLGKWCIRESSIPGYLTFEQFVKMGIKMVGIEADIYNQRFSSIENLLKSIEENNINVDDILIPASFEASQQTQYDQKIADKLFAKQKNTYIKKVICKS